MPVVRLRITGHLRPTPAEVAEALAPRLAECLSSGLAFPDRKTQDDIRRLLSLPEPRLPRASQKRPLTLLLERVGVDLWPDNPSWRRAIRVRLPFKTALWLAKEWRGR